MQITVSTPSQAAPFTKTVGEIEGRLVRALLGGHPPSIAKAIMAMDNVREAVFTLFLDTINLECNALCKKSTNTPTNFRRIPLAQIVNFKWLELVKKLEARSPLLFRILSTIAECNDHRNNRKVGVSRHPGICTAAAIILKERNREMIGVQSILSLLMYSCHCEKQVKYICIIYIYMYILDWIHLSIK